MAEINEELVEQLKKIADSLEDSSKFTEDMNEAVRAMQVSLRSVADLSKSLSQNTEANAEGFSSMVDALTKIKEGMGQVNTEMQEVLTLRQQEKLIQDQIRTDRVAYDFQMKMNRDAERDMYTERTKQRELDNAVTRQMGEQYGFIKMIGDAAKEHTKELVKQGYEYDRVSGEMKKRSGLGAAVARTRLATGDQTMEGMTGFKNMEGMLSSLGTKMSGLAGLGVGAAGVGGILGLIVDSVQRRENFEAFGQQASQAFDTLGKGGDAMSGKLGGLTRSLSVAFAASKESVATVTKAFAEMGIGAEEAMQKMAGVKTGFGSELLVATMSVDKAFEMADGTMAKLVGTMARDFNTTAKEAFINLTNIGTAAKEAGLNAAQFMQQTMQAASALKLMNANGMDVFNMTSNFAASMKKSGFGGQFSGQMAMSGAQSVSSGIAGLNDGFSAIIGERMGLGNGLDAMMALKNPFSRGADNQLSITDVVKEIRNIATETGSTPNEQRFFLQKMGFNDAGAEAILRSSDEIASTGTLSEASAKEIANGLKSESEKTSDITKAVELIKDGFLDIGLGLLEGILGTTKAMYGSLMQFYSSFMELVNRAQGKDAAANMYGLQGKAYGEYSSESMKHVFAGSEGLVRGWDKIVKGAGMAADQFNFKDSDKASNALVRAGVFSGVIDGMGKGQATTAKDVGNKLLPFVPGGETIKQAAQGADAIIDVIRGSKKVSRTEEPDVKQNGGRQ